jgi:hypothetical protein
MLGVTSGDFWALYAGFGPLTIKHAVVLRTGNDAFRSYFPPQASLTAAQLAADDARLAHDMVCCARSPVPCCPLGKHGSCLHCVGMASTGRVGELLRACNLALVARAIYRHIVAYGWDVKGTAHITHPSSTVKLQLDLLASACHSKGSRRCTRCRWTCAQGWGTSRRCWRRSPCRPARCRCRSRTRRCQMCWRRWAREEFLVGRGARLRKRGGRSCTGDGLGGRHHRLLV